jgi:glycosyltransferase involved in cell wall biosynthesis
VHLGVAASLPARLNEAANPADGLPYFLVLATIEPRKNHLLLLNLWRTLVGESVTVPRLIIAGRRGWENEMVLDMLERCDAIADVVEERRDLADAELGRLLQGARAVLLPSFAEGYGLPVAEALAAGAPVICSDLPALREVGGDVPEYIDPLDGLAWRQAILAYSQASSPRRALQCERMRSWSAPRWERHFEQVSAILEDLVQAGHPQG